MNHPENVCRVMKNVGFDVVENPSIVSESDFEVWIYYNDGKNKEALYFEMKIEDGQANLYWQDFNHDAFVCRLDGDEQSMFAGLQKLYCHELDPPIAA